MKSKSIRVKSGFRVSLRAFAVLLCTTLVASGTTPGEEFVSVFGVNPELLGTTNFNTSISTIADKTFHTNSWELSFSSLQEIDDAWTVSYTVSCETNQTSISGILEQHRSTEDAFWSAATKICANALPMFVHARDWTVSTNVPGIVFSHKYPSAEFVDEKISISRNFLLTGNTQNGATFDIAFDLIFDILLSDENNTNGSE